MRNKGSIPTIQTYADVQGIEMSVAVEVEYQPAEPDVNVGEGVEVVSITLKDGTDITPKMTDAEIEQLEMRVEEMVFQGFSDDIDERADWEYEQRRDRELER